MKNVLILTALTVLLSTPATATIVGSSHDMVATGFADMGGNTEICVFCHTPHGATAGTPDAPLWNNTPIAGVALTMYTGSANRSSYGNALNFATDKTKIDATDARLCLACHELAVNGPTNLPNGVIAFTPGASTMSPDSVLTADMSNDHPIGMDLTANPEALDPHIKSIATITGAFGGANPFYGAANTMWCSTCHNVHENANVPFLRIPNTGSALCKACHNK